MHDHYDRQWKMRTKTICQGLVVPQMVSTCDWII